MSVKSIGVPRGELAQQGVGSLQRGEGLLVQALVFAQLAQGKAHRDAVGGRQVLALQAIGETPAVGGRQRAGLDVGQAAPGIAAVRMQRECRAVARVSFVEAPGMYQRVAQQNQRGQEIRCQFMRLCQRIDRRHRVAMLLQVAAEVEPRHRRGGRQDAGLSPAGEGGFHQTTRLLHIAEIGVGQRIVGPLRDDPLQDGQGFVMPLRTRMQQAIQAQGFGVFGGQDERGIERLPRSCFGTVANRMRRGLQMLHASGRQAGQARFGAMRWLLLAGKSGHGRNSLARRATDGTSSRRCLSSDATRCTTSGAAACHRWGAA